MQTPNPALQNTPRRAALMLGLALTVCAAAVQAAAPDATAAGDEAPAAVVRYADLNTSTEAGVDALYRRIAQAARQVCDYRDSRDLAAMSRAQVCERQAIERAVLATHITRLAELHAQGEKRG